MDSIHVTLPDGKSVDVRPGTKIEEIAGSAGVRKTAIAAKVDGRPVDLAGVLDKDCALEFICRIVAMVSMSCATRLLTSWRRRCKACSRVRR